MLLVSTKSKVSACFTNDLSLINNCLPWWIFCLRVEADVPKNLAALIYSKASSFFWKTNEIKSKGQNWTYLTTVLLNTLMNLDFFGLPTWKAPYPFLKRSKLSVRWSGSTSQLVDGLVSAGNCASKWLMHLTPFLVSLNSLLRASLGIIKSFKNLLCNTYYMFHNLCKKCF